VQAAMKPMRPSSARKTLLKKKKVKKSKKRDMNESLETIVRSLARDGRLVEAINLAQKMLQSTFDDSGFSEDYFEVCQLLVSLSIDFGDNQHEKGKNDEIKLAIEYLISSLAHLHGEVRMDVMSFKFQDSYSNIVEKFVAGGLLQDALPEKLWVSEILLFARIGSCLRKIGNLDVAQISAEHGLDRCRRYQLKGEESVQEAEARCHLILCTATSSQVNHVRAMKHARVAASILENLIPSQDIRVIKSLCIAYYNVGAELEHIKTSGISEIEGTKGTLGMDESWDQPFLWYQKAHLLALKHEDKIPHTMIVCFHTAVKSMTKKKQRQPKQVDIHPIDVICKWTNKAGMSPQQFLSKLDPLNRGTIDWDTFVNAVEKNVPAACIEDTLFYFKNGFDSNCLIAQLQNALSSKASFASRLDLLVIAKESRFCDMILGYESLYITFDMIAEALGFIQVFPKPRVLKDLHDKFISEYKDGKISKEYLVSLYHKVNSPEIEYNWDELGSDDDFNVKLDVLESFNLLDITSNVKLKKLKKKKQNLNQKCMTLSEAVSRDVEAKKMARGISFTPVPVTIAGFRLFQEEILENNSVISNNGKLVKWPVMIPPEEINALLGSSRNRPKSAKSSLNKTKSNQEEPSKHKAIDAPSPTSNNLSWSAKLRALKRNIQN